ncbi:MAG TPA: alpha-2-macroglobulin family protein, partial [Chitinophaga sp.]|nr:alpha-2-macroglobulin family protein [Chitinophaga sp.]
RSIYRPGQTVYFKGIVITKDAQTKKSKAVAGYKTTVFLFNANYEKADSLEVITSGFGSYSGKFTLPENSLNGEFSIKDKELNDRAYFSVEEYKRPKFSVEYEPLKGTYQVNDSITVTGLAKAYAGNNIDGAQVKYRVVRQPRFIYPWLYRGWYPQASPMEITNGIAVTNADGKFTITFRAIPDRTVNRQLDPVFDYKVMADITDINGETRSGTITVPVSYKALLLKIESSYGEVIPVDSFKNITITTSNLNGVFEPALVKLSIYSLQAPDRLIRKRYWQQPDQFVLSKEEYIRNFPHDEYANETGYRSWKKDRTAYQVTDSSTVSSTFNIKNSTLPEGWYLAEAVTTDKYGQEVKGVYYFQLFNDRSATLPSPSYTWNDHKNATIEPGERSVIVIGSAADDLFVIQQTDKPKDESPVYSFITLNNQKKELVFTATEDDRGGLQIAHFFVKHNRFYSTANHIDVPWTNKELEITYETWRDKTLPGSEEIWKLKINGYKKEKVAAEMLASMYDASLDQFKPHSWSRPSIWPYNYTALSWSGNYNFTDIGSDEKAEEYSTLPFDKRYDYLALYYYYYSVYDTHNPLTALEARIPGLVIAQANGAPGGGIKVRIQGQNSIGYTDQLAKKTEGMVADAVAVLDSTVNAAPEEPVTAPGDNIQVRKNFNETAFFFPDLRTDASGNIEFSFTLPEALTRWKFQAMTHTRELAFGYSTRDIITQKELMVQPNMPRFLREGDKMELGAKVVNMTDREINGTIQLQLLNAATMQPADALFHNTNAARQFKAAAGQSIAVTFAVDVPYRYKDVIVYRFAAKAGAISDGEEASLPVLTNSMLVTETMPLPVRGNTTKNFRFEKLLQSGNNSTLQQQALTVEYTSNPAWYAVQALPYLMEYPYECAEQTFNRFYANALATRIASSTPKLKAVFEKWKTTDTAALLSNLQKNQELKSVLLEETPWVLQAKNEAQQKKNMALLFDMLRMQKELAASIDKLLQSQTSNGGFSWFKGGPDDRYITQYIVSGIGHLKKLNAIPAAMQAKINTILVNAIPYLDKRLKEDYDQLIKQKIKLSDNNLGYMQIQYLYMRSFFLQNLVPSTTQTAVNYYRNQAKLYWLKNNKYMQGMIALSLQRNGDTQTPAAILASLKENAIVNEEAGMYWKQNTGGYYWHEAPVETQSLLIEAFSEITKDNKTVDDLKTWLLKQKQAQNWYTTKSTADACYALLLQGGDWLEAEPAVEINLGPAFITTTGQEEAGTGYLKQSIEGRLVIPEMGNISVTVKKNSSTAPSWGAVYWQYFEDLDKITPATTPLQLIKKLFVEKNTDRGPMLQPVNAGDNLEVGDKIKVRIELRVGRDMEYVHMKDMRAACLEPVNVISSYKWQDGLGYYESTKDASTNFFFSRLPKGTYVFEYPLFVTAPGNFSNGITSIQCMYAPEFSSHSKGVRIEVK